MGVFSGDKWNHLNIVTLGMDNSWTKFIYGLSLEYSGGHWLWVLSLPNFYSNPENRSHLGMSPVFQVLTK